MSNVFVVDTKKQPLEIIHPARARILLSSGKAAVYKRFPFTIILKVAIDDPPVAELRIKIDPGSKTTGKVKGFQMGDMVRAVVTSGKKVGTYVGRVAVRTTGSFNVITRASTVQGISQKHCQLLHRMDGYSYQFGAAYPRAQAPRKEDLLPPHSSSQGSAQVAR